MLTMMWFVNSEKDVAGIDVNMGCPKEFSIKVPTTSFLIHTYLNHSTGWLSIRAQQQ